ncbi:uncharacterized protein LOC132057874 [Lycium ferocissimum]|uniref:uncharacterized protein LOC132057874 n=1 Tax=Lycium ferocissimum TaxID=112874 RepID=UPI002815967B|nr:uncharacterized protein LOC132057874 [Lycium ferocissimum]
MRNSFDFSTCMDACEMSDLGFLGPKFTWCNNRKPRKRIWKKLDRIFINDNWAQIFCNCQVKHLVRTGSDHRPLLIKCHNDQQEVLEQSWNTNVIGNPMWRLQSKLKILSKNLSTWSREVVGNVFYHVKIWEDKMLILEEQDINKNSEFTREALNKGQAEYVKWMNMQDTLLKLKSQVDWFEEGDCNTKYFHSVIRDRRRKLHLHRIKNHNDTCIQEMRE